MQAKQLFLFYRLIIPSQHKVNYQFIQKNKHKKTMKTQTKTEQPQYERMFICKERKK